MLTQVLWYSLLAVVALVVLITLWAKKQTKKFKRVQGTGDAYLDSTGIFYMIKQLAGLETRDFKTLGVDNFMAHGMKNKMYHQFLGPLSTVLVASGDLAKTVYLDTKTYKRMAVVPGTILHELTKHNIGNVEDDKWRIMRTMMNPSFAKLEPYYSTFDSTIDECFNMWDKQLGNNSQTTIKGLPDVMTRLALDILGRTVFKHDFGALAGKYDTVHEDYNLLVPESFTIWNLTMPWWWRTIPTKKNRSIHFHMDRFRKSLDTIIASARERREREAQGASEHPYSSMLEAMLDAQDSDTNAKLTNEQIRDNAVGFFLAGHETTSNALTNLIYFLAANPRVQEKCFEEVFELVGSLNDSNISFEDVHKLEYQHWTIKENLRITMASDGATYRVANVDTVLGDFKIPKGTMCGISTAGIHNDPEVWGDPSVFRPERFCEEETAKRNKFSYIPFGSGRHLCIGNNFSLLEQRLFLAKFLLKYEVGLAPGHEKMVWIPGKILNPVDPNFSVIIKKRY
jgi:cytochrome P450